MKNALFICFLLSSSLTTPALAYIGPGPGFNMRGEFIAFVIVLFVCLCFALALPIRFLMKKFCKSKPPTDK